MRRSGWLAVVLAGMTLGMLATAGCKSGRFGNMFSRSDEIKMGEQFQKEYARDSKNKLLNSGAAYDRLQRVAARILPLAKADWDVPYAVQLVDSEDVNAFAVPGGPIYFYKGLVDLAESDDEVAAVLGHEAAHIVKRHSSQQISDAQGKAALAEILLGNQGQGARTVTALLLAGTGLKFSRDHESQSDEVGFRYLTAAGYKPEAMASFFEKMEKKNKSGTPEWLSSHPLTRKRIERAQQRAAAYRAGIKPAS